MDWYGPLYYRGSGTSFKIKSTQTTESMSQNGYTCNVDFNTISPTQFMGFGIYLSPLNNGRQVFLAKNPVNVKVCSAFWEENGFDLTQASIGPKERLCQTIKLSNTLSSKYGAIRDTVSKNIVVFDTKLIKVVKKSVSTADGSTNLLNKVLCSLVLSTKFNEFPQSLSASIHAWVNGSTSILARHNIAGSTLSKLIDSVQNNSVETVIKSIESFGAVLSNKQKLIQLDPFIYPQQYQLLSKCVEYIITKSDSAYRTICSIIHTTKEPLLVSLFIPRNTDKAVVDKRAITEKELSNIVEHVTGTPGYSLTPVELYAIERDIPKIHEAYVKLMTSLEAEYVEVIKNAIKNRDVKQLPVFTVYSILRRNHINVHSIPDGFVGNIAPDGVLCALDGKKVKGNPKSAVKMNPQYDGTNYVFTAIRVSDTGLEYVQRYYPEDLHRSTEDEELDYIKVLFNDIDSIKGKWRRGFRTDGTESQVSTLLEILYLCGLSTRSNPKLLDIAIEDITLSRMNLIIKYSESSKQIIDIPASYSKEAAAVVNVITKLVQNKSSKDRVFDDLTLDLVDRRVASLYSGMTVDIFGTLRSTEIALSKIAKNPFTGIEYPIKKSIEDWFESIVCSHIKDILGKLSTYAKSKERPPVHPLISYEYFKQSSIDLSNMPQWLATEVDNYIKSIT